MNPFHKYKLIVPSNRSPVQQLACLDRQRGRSSTALSNVNAGEEQPKRRAVTGCLMRSRRKSSTAEWELDMQGPSDFELSRRKLLLGTAASVAFSTAPPMANAQTPSTLAQAADVPMSKVSFNVNGKPRELVLDTRTTLLDALREHLHLTGSKKGCDHGQCGSCPVILGGRRINSCLTLAVMHEGDEIQTIEGLGTPEKMHPMQAAFVKHDGYQCVYCTPGQICSAVAVLDEIKAGIPSHVTADLNTQLQVTTAELRERMSGNLCRCGAYSNIVEAITEVAGRQG